jgi:hypothetical protein
MNFHFEGKYKLQMFKKKKVLTKIYELKRKTLLKSYHNLMTNSAVHRDRVILLVVKRKKRVLRETSGSHSGLDKG